jgi:hypothetical protein
MIPDLMIPLIGVGVAEVGDKTQPSILTLGIKKALNPINLLTIILAILLLTRMNTLYSTLQDVEKTPDEDSWISGSYFYHLMFIKKDVHHKDWFKSMSYRQPPIGKYLMGFGLDVQGIEVMENGEGILGWDRILAAYCRYVFAERVMEHNLDKDERMYGFCDSIYQETMPIENKSVIEYPDDRYYLPARKTAFFFTVLTTMLLITLSAKFLDSAFTGILAALIYLTNNVTIPRVQQALVDSMCTTFVLLSLTTLIILFNMLKGYDNANNQYRKNILRKKIIPLALLEGLFLSLAVGTKFLTTYMPVTVAAAFTLNTLIQIKSQRKKEALLNIVILATITTTALTLFILGNPFLYPHPMENTMKMLEYRLNMMDVQSSIFRTPMNSPSNRINVVYEKGILLKYRFNPVERLGYIIILLTGMLFLIKKTSSELSARFLGPHAIIILWTATAFIVNGSIVHMEWDWYYIPFALCTSIILGLGVETIIKKMLERY